MNKIFDRKDVFSWSNAEEAEAYISKRGFFGDSFEELKNDINKGCGDNLGEVFPEGNIDAVFRPYAYDISYGLFLPKDKLKEVEEEKKYRPFKSVAEFIQYLNFDYVFDSPIEIENKISSERYELLIIGRFNNGLVLPLYGDLTMEQLFDEFNIYLQGKWQPFGVEE